MVENEVAFCPNVPLLKNTDVDPTRDLTSRPLQKKEPPEAAENSRQTGMLT